LIPEWHLFLSALWFWQQQQDCFVKKMTTLPMVMAVVFCFVLPPHVLYVHAKQLSFLCHILQ
jgi:hypothetical protein